MKYRLTSLLAFIFAITIQAPAITPDVTHWFRNLSEGMGASPQGVIDRYPELEVSGDMVHTLWYSYSDPRSINYRKSSDGGLTWDEKKIIYGDDHLAYDSRYKMMAVSGDYVHIVVRSSNWTTSPDQVLYYRSTDGGDSFAPADTIYISDVEMKYLHIESEGPNVYILYSYNCHYCGVEQYVYLGRSRDNGSTFEEPVQIIKDDRQVYSQFFDLNVDGNNIYVTALESVNTWYEYDYNLHVFSSNDGGNTWNDNIISVPSADGWHHPFSLHNSNDGEVPKTASDNGRVWVTWTGLDENDVYTVFTRTSHDGGNTWMPVNKVNGDLPVSSLKYESATIAGRGDYVYAAWLLTNSKLYVAQSVDGGITWLPPREITNPKSEYVKATWYPRIYMDPSSNDAFAVSSGPIIARIAADGSDIHPRYIGNYDYRQSKYPVMGIDQSGRLHIAFAGGENWVATGNFTDADIIYRRFDPNFAEAGSDNMALHLEYKPNAGDGTGASVADRFTIPVEATASVNQEMTLELWVKPNKTNTRQRLLTQIHDQTWSGSIGDPPAMQIWLQENGQIAAGIFTESGDYTLWSDQNVIFEYWNHIALVYANNDASDNYKLYINGRLTAEATASGKIDFQGIPITIGANAGGFGGHQSSAFSGTIDELRIWTDAKDMATIDSLKFSELEGSESGLAAYYKFNAISDFGEVYDATGNGNNGWLMYVEALEESSLRNAAVSFSYIQQTKTFHFTQATDLRDGFFWDFGDGNTSEQANPQHTYDLPGVYSVCMTAYGDEVVGSYCEDVVIYGVQRYMPHTGGNSGEVTLRIYGGGLGDQTEVHLARDGNEDIVSYSTSFFEPDLIVASFHLVDQAVGAWDVVVTNNGIPATLEQKFTILESAGAQTWARVSAPKRTRPYRWESVHVSYGNDGDVDALLTPLHIFIPEPQGELEVEFIGIRKARMPGLEDIDFDSIAHIPEYVDVDTFGYKAIKGRLYVFHVPNIPAQSSKTFKVRIKTPVTISIQVYAGDPLISAYDEALIRGEEVDYTTVAVCVGAVIADAASDVLGEFVDDISGCVLGVYKTWFNEVKDPKSKPTMYDSALNWSLTAFDCGLKVGKLVAKNNPYFKAYQLIANAAKIYSHLSNLTGCLKPLLPDGIASATLFTFPAVDPNEIYGPVGFGESNYLAPMQTAQYTITFENMADAPAPAAEVYIYDTLDTEFFNIEAFELGAFGFGDTTIIPPPGLREYAIDVDMTAIMGLIVRIQGEITDKGIAKWYFAALLPDSLVVPDDPLIGFLPPNIDAPEGEGFVSYNVGINGGLMHKDVIENKASIVFDYNKPIITNTHLMTIDLVPPESALDVDHGTYGDTTFQININGTDDGAGISHYLIYMSHNDSAYQFSQFAYGTAQSFAFTGEAGSNYKFYAIAVDSVGNEEGTPSTADVDINVIVGQREVYELQGITIYPTVNNGHFTVDIDLKRPGRLTATIYDTRGQKVSTLFDRLFEAGHQREICTLNLTPGVYFIRISDGLNSAIRRIMVK